VLSVLAGSLRLSFDISAFTIEPSPFYGVSHAPFFLSAPRSLFELDQSSAPRPHGQSLEPLQFRQSLNSFVRCSKATWAMRLFFWAVMSRAAAKTPRTLPAASL